MQDISIMKKDAEYWILYWRLMIMSNFIFELYIHEMIKAMLLLTKKKQKNCQKQDGLI